MNSLGRFDAPNCTPPQIPPLSMANARPSWHSVSMNLTVLGFPHSPFCIAIEKVLGSLGLSFTSQTIAAWDRSEILQLTDGRAYEVPLLVHEGAAICESSGDSQDIAGYLDRHFSHGRLFPDSIRGLHEIVLHYLEDEVEDTTFRLFDPFYIESISDVAVRGMLIRHKERKFGRDCVDRWRRDRSELMSEAERLLRPLDEMVQRTGAYLFGQEPVYADFLLSGILGNVTFSGFNEIPPGLTALRDFQARLDSFHFDLR